MDKAQVLNVAVNAYWKDGPSQVSINSICQRAGVSKPSVYREFTNEDGLTCAALESYTQQVLVKVIGILQSDVSFADKIGQVAHLTAQDIQHEFGCMFVKMRAAKPQMGEKTQSLISQIDAMALEAFTQCLGAAREAGDWRGDVPVALGARYLHAQIGLALDQRARGEDPTKTLDIALSVFLRPGS